MSDTGQYTSDSVRDASHKWKQIAFIGRSLHFHYVFWTPNFQHNLNLFLDVLYFQDSFHSYIHAFVNSFIHFSEFTGYLLQISHSSNHIKINDMATAIQKLKLILKSQTWKIIMTHTML